MAKKGNILVVDDEEVMRDVLESLLVAEGYGVELAGTGEEGLDKFQQQVFDVVLLDVSMPAGSLSFGASSHTMRAHVVRSL